MLVLQYFDWHGTMDELDEMEKSMKKIIDEADGVTFKGRYTPHNVKYHFAFLFKCESYNHLTATWTKMSRDYNKMSHAVMEILS